VSSVQRSGVGKALLCPKNTPGPFRIPDCVFGWLNQFFIEPFAFQRALADGMAWQSLTDTFYAILCKYVLAYMAYNWELIPKFLIAPNLHAFVRH